MRIRVAPKGRVERVDQKARLGGILSPVLVFGRHALLPFRLAPKRLPLRQPCRGGARPFAQVLAAIVLLVIATVAASTVARRLPSALPCANAKRRSIQANRHSAIGSRDAVPVR